MNPQEMIRNAGFRFGKTGKVIGLFVTFAVVAVLVIFIWEVTGTGKQLRQTMPSSGEGVSTSGIIQFFGSHSDKIATDDAYYATGAPAPMIAYEESAARNSIGILPPYPGTPASTGDFPLDDKKIIKNGSLDLLVEDAENAVSGISSVASKYEGFVESSNIYERTEGVKSGHAVIRVPSESFDSAFAELKTFARKVVHEESNARDVTAEYVDLEAAIKNYEAEEAQYQEIMDRATKIEDVLNVAARLAEVRSRIDRIEGQLNLLSRQVSMSTISISFTSEPNIDPTDVIWKPGVVFKDAIKDLLEGLASFADFLIRLALYLPILILKLVFFLVVLLIVWRLGRGFYRKFLAQRQNNLG